MDGIFESLTSVDVTGLSHDERLDHLAAIERAKAALDASAQRALHWLASEGDADYRAREWVREEVAGVLRIAPVTAARRLHEATTLVTTLPATLGALADGQITMLHARVLTDAVTGLSAEAAEKVEARVLARAGEHSCGQFRQAARRAVIAADPATADTRHRDAVEQRHVRLYEEDHGMATLLAYLRADHAQHLYRRLTTPAAPADTRTSDQRRADALAHLAASNGDGGAGTTSGGDSDESGDTNRRARRPRRGRQRARGPLVQVSVALSTLLGLDEQPGELDGHGPICPALARAIASDPTGTWRRLITDPAGRLLDYRQTTYRAPAPLRRHVTTETTTCTFPTCRRATRHSHLDHLRPWAEGGPTNAINLHPPCPRHHHLRHEGNWTIHRHTTTDTQAHSPSAQPPGTITWTTPTGRAFHRPPHTHPVDITPRPQPPPETQPPPTSTGSDPPPF